MIDLESQNICHFIPDGSENEKLHIINFVLGTKVQKFSSLKNPSVQQMYYVKNGEGILHTSGGKQVLKKGEAK